MGDSMGSFYVKCLLFPKVHFFKVFYETSQFYIKKLELIFAFFDLDHVYDEYLRIFM